MKLAFLEGRKRQTSIMAVFRGISYRSPRTMCVWS